MTRLINIPLNFNPNGVRYQIWAKKFINDDVLNGYLFLIYIYNYNRASAYYFDENIIAIATIYLSFETEAKSYFNFEYNTPKKVLSQIGCDVFQLYQNEYLSSLKRKKPKFPILDIKHLIITKERQLIFLLKSFHILDNDIILIHHITQPFVQRKLNEFIAMLQEKLHNLKHDTE